MYVLIVNSQKTNDNHSGDSSSTTASINSESASQLNDSRNGEGTESGLGLAALWKQDNHDPNATAATSGHGRKDKRKRARFHLFLPQLVNTPKRIMKSLFAGQGQGGKGHTDGDLLLVEGKIAKVAIRPMATRVYKTRSERDECAGAWQQAK